MAAVKLCLADRKGKEVMPLRPRYFIKAQDVSLRGFCLLFFYILP